MKSLRQKSHVRVLLVGAALLSSAIGIGAQNSAIDEAKAVVKSHEGFARSGNLEGILSNVAEDVVLLMNDAPLIQGKAAMRELYAGLLKTGAFEFGHDYAGAAIVADTVVLHGVARGTFTPAGGQPSAFANNFMLILKRQPNGKFQLWRIAFAPDRLPASLGLVSTTGQTPSNRAADIRARSQALVAAEIQKDIDRILTFWSEDAVVHMEGTPAVRGHQQIRAVYDQLLPTIASFRAEVADVQVAASGDLAYETGTNYISFRSESGTRDTTSKYLAVWRLAADGQWRLMAVSITNNP